jgi:dTDP-4-dehydro-6-deoxy-alpha-D-glucopyranose 2,3-dehydratase
MKSEQSSSFRKRGISGSERVEDANIQDEVLKDIAPDLSEISRDLIISSLHSCTAEATVDDILVWLDKYRQETKCLVDLVPLREMDRWRFDDHLNLRHETGKFFSIEGLRVSTNIGPVQQWSQPIIYQPEVGILGILCQKRGGVLQFLLQAKIEPGNLGHVQLSPTLQATKSNYTRVHEGKYPAFLEYFEDPARETILFDQLQSEQGGRFFKKRNRNMLIVVSPEEVLAVPDNFHWMTLGQIKKLVTLDNIVNMDTRTVLSCISLVPFGGTPTSTVSAIIPDGDGWRAGLYDSLLQCERGMHGLEEILSHLTGLKTRALLETKRCDIDDLEDWEVREYEIGHKREMFFKVVGASIRIESREVQSWCQPLIQPRHDGLVGFLVRRIQGMYHILVQAKMEAGNYDTLELAPTVQCITGNYRRPKYDIPYIEYFLPPYKGQVLFDAMQSEEGGRFYQEQNRYIVVETDDDLTLDKHAPFIWMTLGQAKLFIKFNNYFNVEARSLIACFSPI